MQVEVIEGPGAPREMRRATPLSLTRMRWQATSAQHRTKKSTGDILGARSAGKNKKTAAIALATRRVLDGTCRRQHSVPLLPTGLDMHVHMVSC